MCGIQAVFLACAHKILGDKYQPNSRQPDCRFHILYGGLVVQTWYLPVVPGGVPIYHYKALNRYPKIDLIR